ncbi:MAG: alpha/beta hydrolase [Burkholderiaceae bacterium]
MNVLQRNNVRVFGNGPKTMVFAHGFGCDLNMWRLLAPSYSEGYKVVLFDLVGSGNSDRSAYDRNKYRSLQGYADDLLEVIDAAGGGPVIHVGHSVSAMIGLLADVKSPSHFAAHLMIGPSPAYIDDGDYHGGFARADIDEMLETLEGNYFGWAGNTAPAIMGAPEQPELSVELTNSFCRTDPSIAAHFARTTFLSDNRGDLERLKTPTLILQCSDDMIAPRSVGDYMHARIPNSQLVLIDNVGHCPHLSAPSASRQAIDRFLAALPA